MNCARNFRLQTPNEKQPMIDDKSQMTNLLLAFYYLFGYYGPILNGGQSPATFLAGKLPAISVDANLTAFGSGVAPDRNSQEHALLENRLESQFIVLEDVW